MVAQLDRQVTVSLAVGPEVRYTDGVMAHPVRDQSNHPSTSSAFWHRLAPHLHLVTLALMLGALSCSDDPEPSEEPAPELGAADHCRVHYEALCEQQVGCNVELANQATSVAQCITDARVLCEPRLTTWIDSLEAGHTVFQLDQMTACAQEIRASTCKELAAGIRPRSCRQIFVGDTPRGEDCFTDVECEDNDLCANAGRCPGQCAAPLSDPDAFDCNVAGCGEAEWCTGTTCAPRLDQNEACIGDDASCLSGLFCGRTLDDSTLRCRPLRGIGEECELRTNCEIHLGCVAEDIEFRERYCRTPSNDAEDCFDSHECARGLICDQGNNTCTLPRQDQETCYDPSDCDEGLYCWEEFDPDPLLGVCREDFKVGIAATEPCNPAIDRCRLGLYCAIVDLAVPQLGACEVLPVLGQPCADFSSNLNEQCREGSCVELEDGQFVCKHKGDTGAECSVKDECLSTVCLEGACAAFDEVYCSVGAQ
jgi:hypothetical protein